MAQLWEILRAWWLELVFWKWLRPLLWLFKRSPLRHSLCKEELKRCGYPNFDTSSFVDCAANGLLDKVKLFLDAGITVNGGGRDKDSALIAAARQGNQAIVRLLLDQATIDVNAKNQSGDTALIEASRFGHRDVAEALVGATGIDLNARNNNNESAWIAAIRSLRANDIGQLFKDSMADPRGVEKERLRVELGDSFTKDVFVQCCVRGDTEQVRKFLAADMDVNARNGEGEPALIATARQRKIDLPELLLAQENLDVNASANNGDRPLIVASREGLSQVVERLVQHPKIAINLPGRSGDTALIVAARHGREEVVRRLLEQPGLDVNARNQADESALLEAARRGFDTIASLLGDRGAQEPDLERKVARWQLERENLFTDTEMLSSVRTQNLLQLRKLLVAGMLPDSARDEKENTPLLLAAEKDNETLVRLSLEYRPDVNARNRHGDTALLIAARHGREATVKLLLERGASVHACNEVGESPLLEAARRGFDTIASLLGNRGAQEPDLERKVARWQLEQENLFTDAEMLRSTRAREANQVRKLLVAGIPPDRARDEDQNSPLLLAAKMDTETLVRLLLEYRPDVNARNRHGDTGLLIAARGGREATIKLLLESGADVQARNEANESPLLEAARRKFDAIVKLLVDHGAQEPDLERKVARWQLEQGHEWTGSLFVSAARLGNLGKVEQYIGAGIDVNAPDERLQTALIAAASNNKAEVVKTLLGRSGIDPNLSDLNGVTAADVAASRGFDEIVKILTAAGAIVDAGSVAFQRIREMGLHYSPAVFVSLAKQGNDAAISHFLTAGMHANAEDDRGGMGLIEAAREGHKSVVELLLKSGADPNLRDRFGLSAREVAERNGHIDIAELLAQTGAEPPDRPTDRLLEAVLQGDLAAVRNAMTAGASPDIRSDDGKPALMEAVLSERSDIVAELLTKGAQLGARDREGMTCLMRAAESGLVEIMRVLLENTAVQVDELDPEGRTAVIFAAWQGQAKAVKILIDAGANPGIRDKQGRTALIAAKAGKHAEIVAILEDQGCANDLEQADLLLAAALGDDKRVAELVGTGSSINLEVSDQTGNTALALAASRGWTRSMGVLMTAGARPDAANSEGDTPLMQAARNGRLRAVEMLLDKGDPTLANATNARGETALFQAAASGRGAVVEVLAGHTRLLCGIGSGGRTPLVEMCDRGDLDATKALIKADADVNQQQVMFGKSPLMTAILAGHTEVAETLKENGARAGEAEAQLFLAARSGDDEGLREMKLEEVDLNAMNHSGWTALMVAADAGHDGVVKMLLDANADANLKVPHRPETALRLAASRGRTGALALLIDKTSRSLAADTAALIDAAREGYAETVRLLVQQAHAQIDGLNGGKVPLIEAAGKGHLQTAKILLDLGADPRKTRRGVTALKAALLHKHEDVAKLLVQWGCTAGLKEVRLLMAAGKPDEKEVERLLALADPPDLDARDEAGLTALMIACKKGAPAESVVQTLLRHYGEKAPLAVNDRAFDLETPLMFAAMGGSSLSVTRLMQFSLDIHAPSRKRRTALMEACKSGSYGSVKILLDAMKPDERNVAVNDQDKYGNTPLSEALLGATRARQNQYAAIVKLLKQYDANQGLEQAEFLKAVQECDQPAVERLIGKVDVNALRYGSKTPLMLAVESGCLQVAEYLISKGSEVNEPGPSEATALILAVGRGIPSARDMVRLLLEHGADCDRTDDRKSSALLHAVRNANEPIAEELIAAGANVNQRNSADATPLILAVDQDVSKPRLVRLLLEAKRKVEMEAWTAERGTALTLAHLRSVKTRLNEDALPGRGQPLPGGLIGKLTEVETLLIKAGAREGWDEAELILAIQNDDTDWALELMKMKRPSIHTQDLDGSAPLLLACHRNNVRLTRALLKDRASPAVRNNNERTPLMEAAKNGNVKLVNALLTAHPDLDLDAQDKYGESALLEAARAGATEVVCRLLDPLGNGIVKGKRGASVHVANRAGDTPLIEMARHPAADAVRALLDCGANACARTARHRTATIEAAAAGRLETLQILIEHLENRLARDRRKLDTVINAVDDQSRTALDWADSGKHGQCVKLLKDHGGKSVNQTNFVVFTAPTGDCYHTDQCYHVAPAKKGGNLTSRLYLQALLDGYESCIDCHPGQDPIDWTC